MESNGKSRAGPGARTGVSRPAIAFVVVALVALAVMPVVAVRSLETRRARLTEEVEPARAQVSGIRLSLALGRSALRDFLVTGDSAHLARYRRSALEERTAYQALRPLMAGARPDTENAYRDLQRLEDAWRARAEALLADETLRGGAAAADLARTDLYEQALAGAERLDRELGLFAAELRRESEQVERNFLLATVLLAAVALAAALVVIGMGRRLQRSLEEADRRRAEVEELLHSKSQLVRGITHDLKNPLSAIEGYAQLMEQLETPTERQAQYLTQIHQAAGSMLEIIERMLELARAEGSLRIEMRSVDPASLVRDLVQQYRASLEGAELAVSVDVAQPPRRVRTDPARVREVLGNLLSNARKYTPPGGRVDVTVARARAGPRGGHHRWCTIAVRDSGPGIEPELRSRIFDEFTRGKDATGPGIGLGLAIARRIARLLGGDLTLDSEPGRGSTFTLWLPR